jgi:predicted outer membrane repeat protein
MSVSCVCASDNTTATVIGDTSPVTADTANSTMAVDVDNSPATVDAANSAMTADVDTAVPGTYDDLNDDIQKIAPGSVYDITRDYKFDGKGQTIILNDRIIVISQDNILINGNGHTIDAGGRQNFAIFKITGNNVTIMDLKFINSEPGTIMGPTIYDNARYQKVLSPISWYGNDGVLEGCIFYNDCSVNGGALTWMGNNGTISNCLFENNTARGVGGAIYIGGTNNTISNCRFVNSTSQLSGEVIYIDRNRNGVRLVNDTFLDAYPTIDGAVVGMDTNYLYYSYMVNVYGNMNTAEGYRINIIPLIYKSLVMGGIIKIDDVYSYYAQYNNETGTFTLNIVAHESFADSYLHMDADYLKSFCFSNITDINQIFDGAIHVNYRFDITQVITGYVSNKADYEMLSHSSAFGLWFSTDKGVRTLTNGLRIVFTDKMVIDSSTTWDAKKMGYNTITIMGNGSTIRGGAGDRDEKKWLVIDDNGITFIANDLTISGFNTAVECLKGTCYFTNVNFNANRMDYWIDRDWGAAILNTGVVICDNCSFTNNYAKYGGAVFNQGYLSLNNCTFKGNTAYGEKGDNVCVGDGGVVKIDNENVTKSNSIAYFAESISASTSTWMTVVSIAGSFAIGFIAGVITANPIAGAAIGFAVGAAIGTFTAAEIISSHYDINYNRLTTCLFVIGGSAAAGALGGFAGYWASGATVEVEPEFPVTTEYNQGDIAKCEGDPLLLTLFGK